MTCGMLRLGVVVTCVALWAEVGRGDNPALPAVPAAPAKPLVVGFSQLGAESAWTKAQSESIRNEARKRGVELRVADARRRQENQIRAMREFITARVDAIVLAPVAAGGLEEVLKAAKEAKIPVVVLDRELDVQDPTLFATVIAPDMEEEGRMAAKWLAQRVNGKARIVELKGVAGSAPAMDRNSGFCEVIQQHAEMKIVIAGEGGFERAKGKKVMGEILKAGDPVDAVFAHNDDMALGAIEAIEEAGKKPGQDIVLVSIDGVKDALEAVLAGKLGCTVEYSAKAGPAVFDMVERLQAGKHVPRKIPVKGKVFDQKAAKEAIDSRRY